MSLFGGFGLIFRDYVGLEGVVYRKYLQAQWVLPTTLFWDCWDTVSFFFWQMRNQVRLLVHTDLIDSNMSFQAVELLCAKFALPDYVVIPKKLESKTWLKPSERYLLTEHHGHDGQNIFIQSCLLPTFVDATQNPSSVYNPSRLFDPHDT